MNNRMPAAELLPATAYRVMPWRNGRGTTTEIALAAGTDGRFLWRVSIADVPDPGPFSSFAGYDRIIAVVAGAGMVLSVGDRPAVRLDQESDPHAFSGDATTECALIDGPIRDFNLILDRATTTGTLARLRLSSEPVPTALDRGTALIHALVGRVTVDAGALGRWALPEGDTLRLDGPVGTALVTGESGGRALVATVSRR